MPAFATIFNNATVIAYGTYRVGKNYSDSSTLVGVIFCLGTRNKSSKLQYHIAEIQNRRTRPELGPDGAIQD